MRSVQSIWSLNVMSQQNELSCIRYVEWRYKKTLIHCVCLTCLIHWISFVLRCDEWIRFRKHSKKKNGLWLRQRTCLTLSKANNHWVEYHSFCNKFLHFFSLENNKSAFLSGLIRNVYILCSGCSMADCANELHQTNQNSNHWELCWVFTCCCHWWHGRTCDSQLSRHTRVGSKCIERSSEQARRIPWSHNDFIAVNPVCYRDIMFVGVHVQSNDLSWSSALWNNVQYWMLLAFFNNKKSIKKKQTNKNKYS